MFLLKCNNANLHHSNWVIFCNEDSHLGPSRAIRRNIMDARCVSCHWPMATQPSIRPLLKCTGLLFPLAYPMVILISHEIHLFELKQSHHVTVPYGVR